MTSKRCHRMAASITPRLRAALERLTHTAVRTNIRPEGKKKAASFHWLESWTEVVDETTGETTGVTLTLPDWLFDGMLIKGGVLTIHEDYFVLTSISLWTIPQPPIAYSTYNCLSFGRVSIHSTHYHFAFGAPKLITSHWPTAVTVLSSTERQVRAVSLRCSAGPVAWRAVAWSIFPGPGPRSSLFASTAPADILEVRWVFGQRECRTVPRPIGRLDELGISGELKYPVLRLGKQPMERFFYGEWCGSAWRRFFRPVRSHSP